MVIFSFEMMIITCANNLPVNASPIPFPIDNTIYREICEILSIKVDERALAFNSIPSRKTVCCLTRNVIRKWYNWNWSKWGHSYHFYFIFIFQWTEQNEEKKNHLNCQSNCASMKNHERQLPTAHINFQMRGRKRINFYVFFLLNYT